MGKPSYEEFEPLCKWRKEEQQDVLEVHLLGFKKEQLKVQIQNKGTLIISGQRPLDETRWSRFTKTWNVSKEYYKSDDIHAKFSGGILYITIKKKVSSIPRENQTPLLPQKSQENVKENKQIDQGKEPKDLGAKESGARDKIAATANGTASTSAKPTECASLPNFSVPGLKMHRKTAVKVGALATMVVVVVTIGAYLAYKYYESFQVDEKNSC